MWDFSPLYVHFASSKEKTEGTSCVIYSTSHVGDSTKEKIF